jgi:hypothetical protein
MIAENMKQFIKKLDSFTGDSKAPTPLSTIHQLSASPKNIRLCATNGFVLAICDVSADLIDFAVNSVPPLLYKKVSAKETFYVTPEKAFMSADCFPYPDIMRLFSAICPLSSAPSCIYTYDNILKFSKLKDIYNDDKKRKTHHFDPNYSLNKEKNSGKIYIQEGLLILLMPVKSLFDTPGFVVEPIKKLLPGFIKK